MFIDENVDADLAPHLRDRQIDALSIYDLQQCGLDDERVLAYAAQHRRVVLTHNVRDFLALHRAYVQQGRFHAGILLTRHTYIGDLVTRLLPLLRDAQPDSLYNQVRFI